MRKNSQTILRTIFILYLVLFGAACGALNNTISSKSLRSMTRAYTAFGRYDNARTTATAALRQAQAENVAGGELALCHIDLGMVYGHLGLLGEAADHLEQGIALQKEALFEDHPYVAHSLRMLSDVYRRRNDLSKSEAALAAAIKIMLGHCDIESKEMGPFILEAANLQFAKGDYDNAAGNYQTALDLYESAFGSNHLMTANVLEKMAEFYMARRELAQAERMASRSLAVKSAIFGRQHANLINNWLTMASIYKAQGQGDTCEYYIAKVTEAVSQSRNVVTVAEVYDQIRRIRSQNVIASAFAM